MIRVGAYLLNELFCHIESLDIRLFGFSYYHQHFLQKHCHGTQSTLETHRFGSPGHAQIVDRH